jgi:pilus assembly protein CpaB
MKSRAIIPLVVGLAVGGIAIKVFFNVLKKAKGSGVSDTVEVVRAAADIAPTIEIGESMVTLMAVPKPLLPDGVYTDAKQVIGRVSSQMIPKGMPITPSLLAPEGTPPGMVAMIQDGYRAVAIQVDEIAGVGGFIKPGARVDVVMVVTGQGRNSSISRVILQNVEVLAVGQKTEAGSQGAAVTRSVTVLVKPEEASKLHLASTKGKLRLAMRSQDDRSEPKAVTLTDEDLLTDGAPRNKEQGAGMLAQLLGNLPKTSKSQDDVRTGLKASPPSIDKDWTVEVLSGTETFKVNFDSEGRSREPVSTGGRKPNTSQSKSPSTDATVRPADRQKDAVSSHAITTPTTGRQETGTGEQVDMLEASSSD